MSRERQIASALDTWETTLSIDGDRAAFERLYLRWHPRLLRFAGQLMGHTDDAKDVMQDAAIAIARNIHRLEDAKLFGPWAYTIVRRRAADYIKSASRARRAAASASDAPQATVPDNDEHLALRQALAKLKSEDRLLLTLFYLNDMTGPELSAAMGIPLGTLKSRLFDAREHLRQGYNSTPNGADND